MTGALQAASGRLPQIYREQRLTVKRLPASYMPDWLRSLDSELGLPTVVLEDSMLIARLSVFVWPPFTSVSTSGFLAFYSLG